MAYDEVLPLPPLTTIFPYIHADPKDVPPSADPFTITTSTGFLPLDVPLNSLPPVFDPLTKILDDMPVTKANGQPGLLAAYKLGPLIDRGALPDLTLEIDKLIASDGKPDMPAITAAFRDYSFVASSYLLEPCWQKWNEDREGGYGLGRQVLPQCIAGPLVRAAEILDIPPFMSYAASYALYNYSVVERSKGTDDYDNIRLVRAFEHGLDPKSSEAGFILTHVHMVSSTADLVEGAVDLLEAIEGSENTTPSNTATSAACAFKEILDAMKVIEESMEKMWSNSLPKDYISYRTFIFGTHSQSMFPNGVVYEGQFEEKPQYLRGESGANDSIIPLLDHLCEVPMPTNPLTDILKDFRRYRPLPHRQFLSFIQSKATELGVAKFCVHKAGFEVAALYLKVLEHVRSFRWRHWLFAREYIIKRSKHPTATGGSPIVTWLPNQLSAVMELMEQVYVDSGLSVKVVNDNQTEYTWLKNMMENVSEQKAKLHKEVSKYCEERGA